MVVKVLPYRSNISYECAKGTADRRQIAQVSRLASVHSVIESDRFPSEKNHSPIALFSCMSRAEFVVGAELMSVTTAPDRAVCTRERTETSVSLTL